ncbi:OLC1v1008708C1 [Oldenlandia corymbosa var. corymbosa]|uniref:OLC1v1008708C1 n=1 Tax=Oldenlandia corymbosa var. corymbosa TaxID=529605 RepID=A0AAV1DPP6_OLDCO|nr:OLC1v1008708C1 [Oldenlandia corymbosa var. corymbosa]
MCVCVFFFLKHAWDLNLFLFHCWALIVNMFFCILLCCEHCNLVTVFYCALLVIVVGWPFYKGYPNFIIPSALLVFPKKFLDFFLLLSATEWVKGKQMEEVLTIKNTEIAKHLSLPPVKLHCSMLVEDAIKADVKDYEAKRAKRNEAPKE